MMLRRAAATLMLLAGTTVWAQSADPAASTPAPTPASTPAQIAAPSPLPPQQGFSSRRMSPMRPGLRSGNMPTISPQQRLQDLQDTVTSMQALLTKMRAKTTAAAKDSLAKQNLDMWDLMLKHMDKQLQDLKVATAAHEDMERRRAAMYKQADDKATVEAQAARAANAAKLAAGADATPAAAPGVPSSPAPAPAAPAPSAGSTSSPN